MKYGVIVLTAVVAAMTFGTASGAIKNSKAKTGETISQPENKAPAAPPVTILSIIPAQGEPNMSVILYGTGFSEKTITFLGNMEVPTKLLAPQQISFDIPKLAPGLYALFLKREDGTTSRTYNFSILPPKPYVDAISPDSIDVCSTGKDREIAISGRNFQKGSQVLFDGAIVRSTFNSAESLSFTIPQVAGGIHQIQVKNPEDTITTPLAIQVKATPEITTISRGENFVNYYNLLIEGINFQPGATIVVEEKSFQVGINVAAGKRLSAGGNAAGEREMLIYQNCTRLIYQRFPVDPTEKDLRIQVINPNGEVSPVVQVTAP